MKHYLLPLMLCAAAGCQVGPDYHAPAPGVPPAYSGAAFGGATNAPGVDLTEWWTAFHDAKLSALIRTAANSNLDVRLARSRVREARAQSGVAGAALYPQVNSSGAYSRSRLSKNSYNGELATGFGQPLERGFFNAGLDASWEIDVFGGVRRSVEAANARLQGAVESVRDVQVTVLAEVGLNYLELREAQKQLGVAEENLRTQEDTLSLTKDRAKAGLADDLDASRAAAQVAATRAQIPPLREARLRAIHRLGVLLGQPPETLETQLLTAEPLPAAPPRVPVGLPSDLLRQRPDLRAAERQLAAATADVGVAKADLFPKFFLTGAAGLQSIEANDFLPWGSRYWSLGPGVQWPVFAGGKIRQNIRVRDARQEQALLTYEETVLTALEEVENALVAFGEEQERFRALADSERSDRRSVELATKRYRGGLVNFLDVLDAQAALLTVQDQLARSEAALGQNAVRLYKALGGGWKEGESTAGNPALSRR